MVDNLINLNDRSKTKTMKDCAFKHKAWETVVVHPAKFLQRQLCKHSSLNPTGHLGCFF